MYSEAGNNQSSPHDGNNAYQPHHNEQSPDAKANDIKWQEYEPRGANRLNRPVPKGRRIFLHAEDPVR